ncbi:tetratricopeptide repeat protein [Vibrio sp. CAU 1672]|uniref:tetratricopeptide repeat protein n=1 Tax=Vibrio sp. CAU 1672 TaxID=3032594 RepID=UPI0023DA8511|nr:tetratricopeptide repeat protein [Vibrio sp. CAU 1672]MDF2153058.1 tetratricopeptide repeat protein [Vibrio sp. CAU 1672]
MSSMGIAIGATGLSLVLIFIWMISLSMRKQRLEQERKERAAAYRKAMQKAREQEQKDREFKAETGHIPTILFLAKEAERNNLNKARLWYEKAAKLDNITGMYGVVRISERLRDDVILREQANYWRTAIAGAEGDTEAKFATGKALVFGRGIEKDIPKGTQLIEEAATEGSVAAMLYMGEWQRSADNPSGNHADALYWFMRAAEKESAEGKIQVGLCYLNGTGTEKDLAKGRYWLELAAESGHAEAMYHAGNAWRDYGKTGNAIAYVWLFLSANLGYEPARSLRDQVATNIGVDVVVGLQAIAKPMQRKLAAGGVKKHAIIRALNKVYKREPYFPDESNLTEVEGDDLLLSQDVAISDESARSSLSESAAEPQLSKEALDFTQEFLQPQNLTKS